MPILTPEERIGSTIGGKYRIDRILAAGGMGTVFAGVHEWTHRPVAVKVLNYEHARDPEIVRRFLQEARAAAQLKHPNVVDVLDMGQEPDGSVYLVLELLEGETLKARMRQGPLELGETAEVLGPIMRALATAHRKGVVHRDLKPDNIFLTYDESGQLVPKLLDFGIAKVGSGDSSSTRTGTMVGTPHFMAPEQVRGERDVGPAADVWSMGVVLYACLSGRLPFDSDSTAAVLAKVSTERPPPLLAVAPHLPPELGELVDRAMQPRAADRFHDIGEMLAALSAAVAPYTGTLGSPALASLSPPTPAPRHDPGLRDLEGPPTVQVDPATLSTPPPHSTPLAWSAEPPAPVRSRSALWIGLTLGGAALLGVVGGSLWMFGRGEADAPVQVAPALPPPIAIEPAQASDTAVVDTTAVEQPAPDSAIVEPVPSDEAEPADPALPEDVREPQLVEEAVAPEREPPARADADDRGAPRRAEPVNGEPRERPARRGPRDPVRGTRGALILR